MVGEYQRAERLSSEKESISRNSVDKVSLQEYTLPYAAHQIGFQQFLSPALVQTQLTHIEKGKDTMLTVLLNVGIHEEGIAALKAETEVLGPLSNDETLNLADKSDIGAIIAGSTLDLSGKTMDLFPDLRALVRPGIGVDNIDILAATERGICVINTPDAPTESTAEHAVALIMNLAARVFDGDRVLRQGYWEVRAQIRGTELQGKTVGVIGLGRIGSRVVEICKLGLEMRVLAYDPYVDPARAEALDVELKTDLMDIIPQADFLTLHVPNTPQTRGMIDGAVLGAMKPTAYLVNCARGPIVDEKALIKALQEGTIAGAGVDVYDPEPPEVDNPLFSLPNTVCTPHIASFTEDGVRAMGVGAAEGALAVLRSERQMGSAQLVNPEVWGRRR